MARVHVAAVTGAGSRVGRLSHTQPVKKGGVYITSGPKEGRTGQLIGIDIGDGIVKMDSDVDIRTLGLATCAGVQPGVALDSTGRLR
jgi:hypothetical protein